jgi:hypothetical protein
MAKVDITQTGIDPNKPGLFYRGLNLLTPTELTPEEITHWHEWYRGRLGVEHGGFDFWINNNYPEPLKRYGMFVSARIPATVDGFGGALGASPYWLAYALLGFDYGLRYLVHIANHVDRLTKTQVLELLSLVFLDGGPPAAAAIARALEGYEWAEPKDPWKFEAPYSPDSDAFKSGLDFRSVNMTDDEKKSLAAWYMKWEGEIPPYVQFLLDYHPDKLKAYRARYENALHELPKQAMPMTLMQFNMFRGWKQGIRENVLLAKAWGIRKRDLIGVMTSSLLGIEALSLFQEAAGDIIADWRDDGTKAE